MSETEHTKLPWLAGTRIRIHGDGWSWVDFGYLAAGTPERVAEAKANAAFIERAVNAHDALVAALRTCACPRPGKDQPADDTAGGCFDAGLCGCDNGYALSLASASPAALSQSSAS